GDLRLSRGLGLHGGELFDLALDLQDRLFEVGEVAVHEGLTLTQMNSMLATEPTAETEAKRTTLPPLETWANNERMRHVPNVDWMIRKIDSDFRKRIATLAASFANLTSADPHYAPIEKEFRALCKAIDRLTDAAKPTRHNGNGGDLSSRIDNALTQAAASLRSV